MKKFNYLIVLTLAICMIACSGDTSVNQIVTETKAEISVDNAAVNLESSFRPLVRSSEDDSYKNVYPDYYCGYYGEDDKLIILVKDISDKSCREDLEHRCATSNFELKQADLSMNELENIRNVISDSKTNGIWDKYHITGCGVDVKENKVLILVDDISNSNIEALKNEFFDYKLILKFLKFELKENDVNEYSLSPVADVDSTVPIIPGAGYYATGGSGGTVGYKTIYKTKPCFVTTAHSVGSKGNTIKDIADYTSKVATVTEYDLSGYDLAVCTIESGFANSNTFTFMGSSVSLVSGTYQVSIANKTKVGCKTFYSNKGQETATVYFIDVELKGRSQRAFALAAYKAQDGDSGSLVFCPDNNQAVGIHVADGGNGYSAYLPCKYINMKFGTLPK